MDADEELAASIALMDADEWWKPDEFNTSDEEAARYYECTVETLRALRYGA